MAAVPGTTSSVAATFVANLIPGNFRQEGFKPDRDIIVVLQTDEEILDHSANGESGGCCKITAT